MRFEWPWRTARRIRADVAEEFAFHVAARSAELAAGGMDPSEARRRAQAEFGDAARAAAACERDDLALEQSRHRSLLLDEARQDVAWAWRTLRRRPAFTLAAAATLALGIGATTALFSAVHGVLLRPLPYHDQDRLITVWQRNPTGGQLDRPSPGNFLDLRERSRVVSSLAAAEPYGMDLTGHGDPVGLETWRVTEGFFEVLGVRAAIGRVFAPSEYQPGNDRVVMLSHGDWVRMFGADSGLIGRTLTLDGAPFTVVGVLPAALRFPSEGSLWVPRVLTAADLERRAQTYYTVIGRVGPGQTMAAAREEIARLGDELVREYPRINAGVRFEAIPISDWLTGPVKPALILLFAAVVGVLLIACGNVAGLLLARGSERGRELAVRIALGAGRGRLLRQLLTESLVLAAIGGGAGLALAAAVLGAARRLAPDGIPRLDEVTLAGWPLLFTVAATLLTAAMCGLLPARAATGAACGDQLRGGSPRRTRLRELLVTTEVALALVLLISSGLLLRSFASLLRTDLGYGTEGRMVLTVHVWDRLPDPSARIRFFEDLEARLLALPGVRAAGAASSLPLSQEGSEMDPPFIIMGRPEPPPGNEPTAMATIVTPGYFTALGVPLKAGRLLSAADRAGSPLVGVISETMARRFWPAGDAIGSRIRGNGRDTTTREIVGIVGDTRRAGHQAAPMPELYVPQAQRGFGSMSIVVATAGDHAALLPAVQRTLWEGLPGQTYILESLSGLLADSLAARRFGLVLLGAFAVSALLLAVVGIYGLMSVLVAQRTRELGVRIALGAAPSRLVGELLAHGAVLATVGLAAGALAALAVTRLLRGMLVGISPNDPETFGAVVLLALGVAVLATWIPARRTARIDPLIAMRAE